MFMAVKVSLSRKNNILRRAAAPLFSPIYMVCRGTRKNRGEYYRTDDGFKASLSRESQPGLVTGAPTCSG